jgi:glycosyltransferase involved in cell wall biosynthesis
MLIEELEGDIQLFTLDRSGRFDLPALSNLWKFCRAENVDVLHVHGRSSFMLIAGARLLGKLSRRVQILMHDHYGDIEIHPQFPWSLKIAMFILQPYYVGVHPLLVARAGSGVLRCRSNRLIQNAIEFRLYELEGVGQHEDLPRPVGVMVANIRPSKNVLLLLRALSRLGELEWSMLLVGALTGEYSDRCIREANRLGIGDRIHFMGMSNGVPGLLKRADFAVLSSASEAGPLALIEYVAANKPFVSTRVGAVAAALESMGIGLFVPAGDEEALSDALGTLISGEHGDHIPATKRDRAKHEFDMNEVISRWINLYREIGET